MPHNVSGPCFALSAGFDARAWGVGVDLFTRDGITTVGSVAFGVIHDDIMAALNSHGMFLGVGDGFNALYGSVEWTAGIDEYDRFYIENSTTDFEIAAELYAGNNSRWPYPAGGTGLAGGAAPFRHTGTADWVRGQTDYGNALLSVTRAGTTKRWPPERGRLASVPHATRTRGSVGDADDGTTDGCLEALEDAVASTGSSQHTHMGLTADGRVWWEVTYTTYATTAAAAVTWNNPDLRDALGFTGDEIVTNVDVYRYRIEGTNVPPSLMLFERPLTRVDHGTEQSGSSAALIGGGSYHVDVSDYPTTEVDFIIGGPADAVDESCRWLRTMVPQLHDGAPVTLYQDYPEFRRRGWACLGDNYDSLRTVEHDGYRGRLLLWMTGNAGSLLRWAGALRSRASIALRMRERER